jgi:hypothetical protein
VPAPPTEPDCCRIAFGIKQVVSDLKREAEHFAIAPDGRPLCACRVAQDRSGFAGKSNERPGFHGVQTTDVGGGRDSRQAEFFRFEVERLATYHACAAGRPCQSRDELQPN